MKRKFKVGDMVRIRKDSRCCDGIYAGQQGMVKREDWIPPRPYIVDFGVKLGRQQFHTNELELMEI